MASVVVAAKKQRSQILKQTIQRPDQTIQPLGVPLCVYKRWGNYDEGNDLWLWKCKDAYNKNKKKSGKYKWKWNPESGLILSVGSKQANKNKQMCWNVQRPSSEWGQRVKIARCNPASLTQIFELHEGRIFLREFPHICVGFETGEDGSSPESSTLNIIKCYANNWGIVDEDEELTCGDNEHYEEAGFKDCQKSCGDKKAKICPEQLEAIAGCYCDDGFFRNGRSGVCEPEEKCEIQPACPLKNQVYEKCGSSCVATCQNPIKRDHVCTKVCWESGVCNDDGLCVNGDVSANLCQCAEGYILDEVKNACVKWKDCPAIETCEENEEYKDCGSECYNCETQFLPVKCNKKCRRGCFCKEDYLRDPATQECVLAEECPVNLEDIIPVCKVKGERYSACGADAICKGGDAVLPTVCEKGCFCRKGLVRNKLNECVKAETCEASVCNIGDDNCCGERPFDSNFQDCCDAESNTVAPRGRCSGCPANMEEVACVNQCGPTCKEPERKSCPHIKFVCSPGCQCVEGMVLGPNGRCIEPSTCPVTEASFCGDLIYNSRKQECCDNGEIAPLGGCEVMCPGDNQVYKLCGSACAPTCKTLQFGLILTCTEQCVPDCFCADDFVRDDISGECVPEEECKIDKCADGACCNGDVFDKEREECCNMFVPIPGGDVCEGQVMAIQFLKEKDGNGCIDTTDLLNTDKCFIDDDATTEAPDTDSTTKPVEVDPIDDRCEPGQFWVDNRPRCEKNCRDLLHNRICRETDSGFPGCTCEPGLFRDLATGECVTEEQCLGEETEDVVEICVGKHCCGPADSRVKFEKETQECCSDGTVAALGECTSTEPVCGTGESYHLCPHPCMLMTCGNIKASCLQMGSFKGSYGNTECASQCICDRGTVRNSDNQCVALPDCQQSINDNVTDDEKLDILGDIFQQNFEDVIKEREEELIEEQLKRDEEQRL